MKTVYVPVGLPAIPVDIEPTVLREELGIVSFAYPFEDENIGLAHDDDGIANHRLPNRTIGSEIIPGPFYVVRINNDGELCDLLPSEEKMYTEMFVDPEIFPPGQWKVHTKVEETKNSFVLHMISEWVTTDPSTPSTPSEGEISKDGVEG